MQTAATSAAIPVAGGRYMKLPAPIGVAAMCAGGGMATALVLDVPG